MQMTSKRIATTLFAVLAAGPALGQSLTFTLTNQSSDDVVEFYVSHSGTREWEDNLLRDAYLPAGNEVDVSIDDNRRTCEYDVRAVFRDGSDVEDYRVDFCDVNHYVLEDAQHGVAQAPPGASTNVAARPQFDDPEKVFNAATRALQRGDMSRFIQCLTPTAVSNYAVNLAGVMAMTVAFADMMEAEQQTEMKKLRKVLDRHGVTEELIASMENSSASPEIAQQMIADSIADKHRFIVDIHRVMQSASNSSPGGGAFAFFRRDAVLEEYSTQGDHGIATVSLEGETHTIEFQRVAGNWLLDI